MAVVIGEAAIAVRADASGTAEEIESEVGPAAEKAGKEAGDKLGEKMKLGVAGAAVAIGAGFGAALEQAALGDKLAAQLGLTQDESARSGAVAGNLYADAYGSSMEEVNGAVAAVMGSISGMRDASSADLEAITGSALNFATAMDVDVSSAATSAGILVKTGLAADAQEAFDLMTVAAQEAGPSMTEPLLEAANEYGTNFAAMGISGRAAMAMLVDASAGGEIALDKAGDAVKEFGIRATDLGDTGAQAALEGLGLSGEDMANKLLAGGASAQDAFSQIVGGLQGIDDPAQQANAAIALFGTPLEDIGKDKLPAFLDAMQQSGGELENVAGASERMGQTLNDNASSNLTSFTRGLQQTFVDLLGGQVIPVVQSIYAELNDRFGPALTTVGGFITDEVVPPLQDLAGWLGENQGVVRTLAGLVTGVLVSALGVWGTRTVIEAAKNTVAWFTTAASSSASAGTQQKSALQVVAGWVLMGAQAVLQGIKVAAVWTAQVVASAVTGAASFAVQVARVVGGWVLMGAQSLLAAGRMAAAWLIAMGPIALVIAAVIGVVALIIANWDTVKAATEAVWNAITGFVSSAWEWIKGAVSAGVQAVTDWFLNWTILGLVIQHWDAIVAFIAGAWESIKTGVTDGLTAVVSFFSGLPGRVWSALSSLGQTLWDLATTAFTLFSNAVSTGVQWAVDYVTALPGRFWSGLSSIGQGLWDLAVGAFTLFSNAVSTGVQWVMDTVSGIPGGILRTLSGIGSLLVDLGGDLIQGLVNGISGAAGFVGDVAGNIVSALKTFINTQVIGRLNNLLEFTVMGVTVNPPDIPTLHSGGIFDSGGGEGLALLRDQERVITPEQRVIADRLLSELLGGTLPTTATAAAGQGGTAVQIDVHASPGMSVGELSAHVANDLSWSLANGSGAAAPALAGSPA